jgi:hypothetical protein
MGHNFKALSASNIELAIAVHRVLGASFIEFNFDASTLFLKGIVLA